MADSPSIALVTCAEYPALPPDERLLIPALAERGFSAAPARWDDPAENWAGYRAVVLRSCWDYHQHAATFERWLDGLERVGARVINPVPTLRWNMRKTYLRDLGARGVPVVATEWAARGSGASLRGIAEAHGWTEMVVKPVVSASAHETWRAGHEPDADEDRFRAELATRDLMVQPFLPGFTAEGELSFIFIAGEFSHAVRKRPKPGDFRVQEEHGGTVTPDVAPPELVRLAALAVALVPGPDPEGGASEVSCAGQHPSGAVALVPGPDPEGGASEVSCAGQHPSGAVAAAPAPPVYARVDTVVTDRGQLVTELELIEPALYFGMGERAAEKLAAALEAALAGTGPGRGR